jgi:WD40 repeat protein
MKHNWLRPIHADDIFISYSRRDATAYVIGLEIALSAREFLCYTDRKGTEASGDLPAGLIKSIQQCRTLVLLATPGALAEPTNLAQELAAFVAINGTARIVAVHFVNGEGKEPPRLRNWMPTEWKPYLVGKSREFDFDAALASGTPAQKVIDTIVGVCDYVKSKDRLRGYRRRMVGALGGLALLIALAVVLLAFTMSAEEDSANEAIVQSIHATDSVRRSLEAQEQSLRARRIAAEVAAAATASEVISMYETMRSESLSITNGVLERRRALLAAQADAARMALAARATMARQSLQLPSAGLAAIQSLLVAITHEGQEAVRALLNLAPEGVVTFTRIGDVPGVAVHTAHPFAAVGSGDGTVSRLDLDTERERWVTIHPGGVNAVAIDPAGKLIVSAGSDGHVVIRDAADGGSIDTLNVGGKLIGVSFSPDGRWLGVASADNKVTILRSDGWTVLRELQAPPDSTFNRITVPFSHDSRFVASGGWRDAIVTITDLETGSEVHIAHAQAPVTCIVFSPIENKVATADAGGAIKVTDLGGNGTPLEFAMRDRITALSFSASGRVLAAGGLFSKTINVWSVTDSRLLLALSHSAAPSNIGFSPDDKLIVAGDKLGSAHVWDASGNIVRVLPGRRGMEIVQALFSPDGSKIITSEGSDRAWTSANRSYNGAVRVWTLGRGGDPVYTRVGFDRDAWSYGLQGEIRAISPDGSVAAVGGNGLRVVRVESGRELDGISSRGMVAALAFSADGGKLVCACDREIRVWDTHSRRERVVARHEKSASAVAIAPSGTLVASGGYDQVVRIRQVDQGDTENVGDLVDSAPVMSVAIAGQGDLVAAGAGSHVSVWGRSKDKRFQSSDRKYLWEEHYPVRSVAFSPDGRWVLSHSVSGNVAQVRVRSVEDGHVAKEIPLTAPGISSAFSRDSTWVAVSSRFEHRITVFEPAVGGVVRAFGVDAGVTGLAFGPQRGWLLAALDNNTVGAWDLSSCHLPRGQCEPVVFAEYGGEVGALALSRDFKWIVAAGRDWVRASWVQPRDAATEACRRVQPLLPLSADDAFRKVCNPNSLNNVTVIDWPSSDLPMKN